MCIKMNRNWHRSAAKYSAMGLSLVLAVSGLSGCGTVNAAEEKKDRAEKTVDVIPETEDEKLKEVVLSQFPESETGAEREETGW